MPTDATGTPTSPDNIPTYNVDADAPSGLGFNAAMAAIQTALNNKLATPAGILTGEVPVWNGTTWVRSSTLGMAPSGLSGYPSDATKVLRGDGSWGKPPGTIMAFGVGQAVSTSSSTFAGGQNLLAANLSFTADGTSRYMVFAAPEYAQIAFAGTSSIVLQAAVDGAAAALLSDVYSTASNNLTNVTGAADLGFPSAATHTVNVKVFGGSGSLVTVPAGALCYVMKVA